jgi:hypothetical protein
VNLVKNYFHQILIAVFFASSFAVFGVFQYLSNDIDDRDVGDYLVSLRENSTVGCLSFYERKNDILVVGDSHSYAALDFYKLSELTKTTKISSCTMGGLYFDSLVELIEKLPSFQSLPTNIIFGLSLRQFTTGSDRESQLKEHGKLIGSMGTNAQNVFLKIKKNLEIEIKAFFTHTSLIDGRSRDLNYWGPYLTQLDPKSVEKVFELLHHAAKDNWQKFMQQLKFLGTNESNIQRFCNVIQKNNINLFLVDLPESPYLQKMYRPEDLQNYSKVIEGLSACSKKVIRMSLQEWGVDGRHFLNRSFNKKFNFKELSEKLDRASLESRVYAFDLDHPNLIGAQIITEKMYEKIREDLKYAF